MHDKVDRNASLTEGEQVSGRHLGLMALSVFLLAVLVYAPKITNGFTFDDYPFILHNQQLRTASGLLREFSQGQANLYRPLRSAALALPVRIFGLADPVPYHVAGILLHALISVLVFQIVRSILGRARPALIAGLIFAAHPVHADRVANITGSFDLVGLLFGYLAWALALAADRRGRPGLGAGAAFCLALGCLASEEAVMVLPLAAGSFLLYRGGSRRRRILIVAWLTAAAVAYLLLRTQVLGAVARTAQYAAGDFDNTIRTMAVVVWRYLFLFVWPVGLAPDYGPRIYPTWSLAPLAGLAGLIMLTSLMIHFRRRQPAVSLAIGWFFLALLPFANLLPADTLMAERYLYAPLGGFAVAAGTFLALPSRRPRAATTALILLLICLSWGTLHRCRLWGDPPALWAQAVRQEPKSYLANLRSAYYALQAGRLDQSEAYARQAVTLKPDRPEPRLQLGEIANRRGRHGQALENYREAVRLAPDHCPAHAALAQGYIMTEEYPEALAAAQQALSCDPEQTVAHYAAAFVLVKNGRCAAAAPHWEAILQAEPPAPERQAAQQLTDWCRKHQSE